MSRNKPTLTIEIPGELQLTGAEIAKLEGALRDEVVDVLQAKPDDVVSSDETNVNNAVRVTSRVQAVARKSPSKKPTTKVAYVKRKK